MESKTISDLISHLENLKEQCGDLELSTGFGERVYDFEDYIWIAEDGESIEIN